MKEFITFVRPSGSEIEIANYTQNIESAKALGWKRKRSPNKKKDSEKLGGDDGHSRSSC